MITRLYIFLLCIVPISSMGQQKTYILNGYVHLKNAGDYPYHVTIVRAADKVAGFSTTSLSFVQLAANVQGTMNMKNKTLAFKESKKPNESVSDACYFDVKLSWKTDGDRYVFTGTFVGRDVNGKFCDEGTVTMEGREEGTETVKPVMKKRPVKKVDTLPPATKETESDVKVTATIKRTFDWHADSCVLLIWDAGVIDSDVVSVIYNGKKLLANYTLTREKKAIVLPVTRAVNTLSVVAENEGKAPPNTAQISLSDRAADYSLQSYLHAGETATMFINKKK